jgi:two-component system, NtrC family, response regulator HydG
MEGYRAKILVVDDEQSNIEVMEKILSKEAYSVVTAKQASIALNTMRRQKFDLVLTDLRMPGVSGLELLRAIRKENSVIPVVLLTAYGTVEDAVEAMKLGALDFLAKPIKREILLKVIQDCLSRRNTEIESERFQFIGMDPEILQIKRTIRLLSRTNATVLIEGESGTGKEVVAKSIHIESSRTGKLINVNCGAIPESLLESELFGYERGAFTGANTNKIGLFEAADGGTLFLDEIGEMPQSLQVKLLRALQDGTFFRLGSAEPKKVDVRVIAATNADLKRKIMEGTFREDLFYRLNVVSLRVPPLRERKEDIRQLADYFLESAKARYGKPNVKYSDDSYLVMQAQRWDGNVRELKNTIERTLVLLEGEEITPKDLGMRIAGEKINDSSTVKEEMIFPVGMKLREMELELIRKTLEFTKGDKAKAAEILGINQRTIYRKLPELER